VKQQRLDEIMTLQREISLDLNRRKIGATMLVINDGCNADGVYVCRSQYDSPEVDGTVLVRSPTPLRSGDFYAVEIAAANEYDLFGTISPKILLDC
jgi:ribosomal protein S12 methylthiotransferase